MNTNNFWESVMPNKVMVKWQMILYKKNHVIWFILKHLFGNYIFDYNFWTLACLWKFKKKPAIACAMEKYRQYSTSIWKQFNKRAIKFLMRICNGMFLCIFCSWYMLIHSLFHPKILKCKYIYAMLFFPSKLMFHSFTCFQLKIKLHEQKSTPVYM